MRTVSLADSRVLPASVLVLASFPLRRVVLLVLHTSCAGLVCAWMLPLSCVVVPRGSCEQRLGGRRSGL